MSDTSSHRQQPIERHFWKFPDLKSSEDMQSFIICKICTLNEFLLFTICLINTSSDGVVAMVIACIVLR